MVLRILLRMETRAVALRHVVGHDRGDFHCVVLRKIMEYVAVARVVVAVCGRQARTEFPAVLNQMFKCILNR